MDTLYFIAVLLAPAAMVAVGLLWKISPPPYRSKGLAYSTELTRSKPEAWSMAHRNCAKLWARIGLISGAASAVVMALFREDRAAVWVWLIVGQMALFCVSVLLVELLLKNTFEDNNQ